MAWVQILKTSHVPLISSSQPTLRKIIKLSLYDTLWVQSREMQNLFLYPETNLPFTRVVETLKSSFSRTLPFFHILAGKIKYIKSSKSVIIDCSTRAVDKGVLFLEAETDLHINRLAEEEIHDMEAFKQLVPNIMSFELPAPVCALQVTKFSNGGVAVGISIHHGVMDGSGNQRFIDAWAKTCRSDNSPVKLMALHDRSAVRFAGDDELIRRLRETLPDLPKVMPLVPRRTFIVNESSIQALQKSVISLDSKHTSPPSRFVSLIAHAWICLTRARIDNSKEPIDPTAFIVMPIDLRDYIDPPIDEFYTGNCVGPGFTQVLSSEILSPTGLAYACTTIENVIHKRRNELLLGCMEWHETFASPPRDTRVNVVSSCRYRGYDIDFGWGRPKRVVKVMNGDGEITLLAGREENTIQMSVAVSAQYMDAFADLFTSGLE
ncbi:hypothetical protein LUZ60_005428 [Juncus effusus]|nr:hypothetical protein LUZ60_005428 [Juncus effusus]